jgi:hypothetical protein
MGAEAVRLLIKQIRGQGPATSVRIPARLVVRESSGGGAAAHPARKEDLSSAEALRP